MDRKIVVTIALSCIFYHYSSEHSAANHSPAQLFLSISSHLVDAGQRRVGEGPPLLLPASTVSGHIDPGRGLGDVNVVTAGGVLTRFKVLITSSTVHSVTLPGS